MATINTYNLDGATTFPVAFEYLARKFVKVTLKGPSGERELTLVTEFVFDNAAQVRTLQAWGEADGYTQIEVRRETSATERVVSFNDATVLRASDLNVAELQSLHIAEEARDGVSASIPRDEFGNLDAQSTRLVNLADPVDPGDAVNLRSMNTEYAGITATADNALLVASGVDAKATQALDDSAHAILMVASLYDVVSRQGALVVNAANPAVNGGLDWSNPSLRPAALQNAHDWIIDQGATGFLTVPTGAVILMGAQSFHLNVTSVRFQGNGSFLSWNSSAGDAVVVTGSGVGTPYDQAWSGITDCILAGDSVGTGAAGIVFDTLTEAGTAQVTVNRVTVKGFGVGHRFMSNAYCMNIRNSNVYGCSTGVTMPPALPGGIVNYGERIYYNGCTIFNNGVGCDTQNPNGNFMFEGCSFDYNAQHFFIRSGAVFASNTHIEANSYMESAIRVGGDGNASFNMRGGVINCTGSNIKPIVEFFEAPVGSGGHASFDGVMMNNLGTGRFATGSGYLRVNGSSFYPNPASLPLLPKSSSRTIDGEFTLAKPEDAFVRDGAGTLTDRWTAPGVALTVVGGRLRIEKKFGGGSACVVTLAAPCTPGAVSDVSFTLTGDSGGAAVFATVTHAAVRGGDFPTVLKEASGTLLTITPTASPQTSRAFAFGGRAPHWATHSTVSLNLVSAPAGFYYVSGLEVCDW